MPHCHFSCGTDSERAVTLEVCAGVASTPTVATVPCPRNSWVLSIPNELLSRGGVHNFPVWQLPSKVHWICVSYLYAIYSPIICEFAGQRQPNLLPVAGGGCASPHSMSYCVVFCFLPPESSSEGIRHLELVSVELVSALYLGLTYLFRALHFGSQHVGALCFGTQLVRALCSLCPNVVGNF